MKHRVGVESDCFGCLPEDVLCLRSTTEYDFGVSAHGNPLSHLKDPHIVEATSEGHVFGNEQHIGTSVETSRQSSATDITCPEDVLVWARSPRGVCVRRHHVLDSDSQVGRCGAVHQGCVHVPIDLACCGVSSVRCNWVEASERCRRDGGDADVPFDR